ncbi:hypothetical protein HDV00_003785 [Rhizophlyctis rosea]|nr:hypothetical protein HDV00_003785 [Rhizophlyctis rosea]
MGKGRDKKKKKKEEKGGAGAKSKQKEEAKSKRKQTKKAKDDLGEPEEDIDAILATFQKEQEALYTVTEESNAPPPSRRSNASFVNNPLNLDELLLFGGEFRKQDSEWEVTELHDTQDRITVLDSYDDLWLFDTTEFKWQKLDIPEPRPTARSGFQFFASGDVISMYGGYCKVIVKGQKGQKAQGMVHNDMWMLKMNSDLSAIRWERRKKPGGMAPTLRSGCTVVPYKGKGILFGGVSDIQESDEKLESICHNDAYQYLIDSNKWYPLNLKGVGKKGKKKRRNANAASSDSDSSDDEDEQRVGVDLPSPRFNAMMSVARNTVYVFGGIFEEGAREVSLADFWSLNLDKLDRWNCILTDDLNAVKWLGEDSDDDDEEEEEEEEQEDEEEEEEDDDGEEEDDDGEEEDAAAAVVEDGDSDNEEGVKHSGKTKKGKREKTSDMVDGSNGSSASPIAVAPETEPIAGVPVGENDPLPKESLRDFYARTSVHWQIQARENENEARAGKALRKDAFALAEGRYLELRPQLEILERQMEVAEAELVQAKARSKEEGLDRLMSRNRR